MLADVQLLVNPSLLTLLKYFPYNQYFEVGTGDFLSVVYNW